MPDFNTNSFIISNLKRQINIRNESLRTGKRDTLDQTVSDLYRLTKYRSKNADLQNDGKSLLKAQSFISLNTKSIENLQKKIQDLKNTCAQIKASTDDVLTNSLIKAFDKGLKDYDYQAKSLGFNGEKSGAPKITTSGSNEYSTIETANFNPIVGEITGDHYRGRTENVKAFNINISTTNTVDIKVKIGSGADAIEINEKFFGTTASDSNESNTFLVSSDGTTKAQNLVQSILKSSSSNLREMFDIKVSTNPATINQIVFTPKAKTSNNITFNFNNGNVVGAPVAGLEVDALEMRLPAVKTSNKTLSGFSNVVYGGLGEIAGANNRAKCTTTILHADIFNNTGGQTIGTTLGSAVGNGTNANNAIAGRLAAMDRDQLSVIIKDLGNLWTNSAAGLGVGYGAGVANATDSNINTLRTKLDDIATANFIDNITRDFLKANFFSVAGDGLGVTAANIAAQVQCYGAVAAGGATDGTTQTIFGNNVHSNVVAQNVIRDINKLVTNVYLKKMLAGGGNGIISQAAFNELTDNVVAGSQLSAVTADAEFYTVKTRYNGKDYIGITGKNAGGGNLNNAGKSIFFFEVDATNGLPIANADIAFKVNFGEAKTFVNITGADDANALDLDKLLKKEAQLRIGMSDTKACAHVSLVGKDLKDYYQINSASIKSDGNNVTLTININNADFTYQTNVANLNALTFNSNPLKFTNARTKDYLELKINDLNDTANSLFKDSNGKAINADNFEEIATKFTAFFNGEALSLKTSSELEIDVEQRDLRAATIMNYAKITGVNKDNINDAIAELTKAEAKLLSELSDYTTSNEFVGSNIESTSVQMESIEEEIDAIEKTDIDSESKSLQNLMRIQSIILKMENIRSSYENNIQNDTIRTLQENIRSM